MSIVAAFGWPPTCAYADMKRLKSNGLSAFQIVER
jgi:hypothetical protein